MFVSETKIRVRYSETDQMGMVYYGNYAQYYEVGRVEAMRELATTYSQMEESGIIMPVITMNTKFIKPARYDDLITVRTTIVEMPSTRMHFKYEIFDHDKNLLNIGNTELVFLDRETFKPCKSPDWFTDLIESKFYP